MSGSDQRARFTDWLIAHRFATAVLILALIGAGVIWFTLQPRQPVPPDDHWIEQQEPAYYPGGPNCRPERLSRLSGANALLEAGRCAEQAEQHRIQENDLAQQRRMADAADAMNELTYMQSQSLRVEAIVIWWAFLAAFAAAFYARRASQATERGNLDSRRNAEWQLIPYIFFDRAELDTERSTWAVDIIVKNFGQSPNTGFSAFVGTSVADFLLNREKLNLAPRLDKVRCEIAAGQEIAIQAIPPAVDWQNIQTHPNKCVLITAKVIYRVFYTPDGLPAKPRTLRTIIRRQTFIFRHSDIEAKRGRLIKASDYEK